MESSLRIVDPDSFRASVDLDDPPGLLVFVGGAPPADAIASAGSAAAADAAARSGALRARGRRRSGAVAGSAAGPTRAAADR